MLAWSRLVHDVPGVTKDNIDSNWQSQYEPRDNVYTGSKDDGPGDPQAGWVDCIQLVQSLDRKSVV